MARLAQNLTQTSKTLETLQANYDYKLSQVRKAKGQLDCQEKQKDLIKAWVQLKKFKVQIGMVY
jgi:hypothetical protein